MQKLTLTVNNYKKPDGIIKGTGTSWLKNELIQVQMFCTDHYVFY